MHENSLKEVKKGDEAQISKKNLFGPNFSKMGPNLPKFDVFGKLFKVESLDFSDFAYLNRQTGFLNDSGGPVAGKKF